MSDEPLTFSLIFTIPQLDSAFMRNPAGGARMKIDIQTETVEDANRMLDLMVTNAGVTFAAVVVVVKEPEKLTIIDDETTEEPEKEVARMDLRRSTKRRNKPARG